MLDCGKIAMKYSSDAMNVPMRNTRKAQHIYYATSSQPTDSRQYKIDYEHCLPYVLTSVCWRQPKTQDNYNGS